MTPHSLHSLLLRASMALALGLSCLPAYAHDAESGAEHAGKKSTIRPVPGLKGCLHHIAHYDESGNFLGYRTVKGPCH